MKKLLVILCALMLYVNPSEARSHIGHHSGHAPKHHISTPLRHHHHHRGDNAAVGFVAGLIGGSILNYALNSPSTRTYTTTTTSYSPMVVSSPIVSVPSIGYSAANVITTTATAQPCYTSSNLVTGATVSSCAGTVMAAPVITQTYTY